MRRQLFAWWEGKIYMGRVKVRDGQLFIRSTTRAGEQLRRGANLVDGVDDVPPYFDTFAEYKEFCVQYRSKLSHIVRGTAGWLPEQARSVTAGSTTHEPRPTTDGQCTADCGCYGALSSQLLGNLFRALLSSL